MKLSPGQLLDHRFRLVRLIGSGGMGRVWLARDEERGVDVAVKHLALGVEDDPVVVERFRREARLVTRLCSPHIVQGRGTGELEDGLPYFVMEYVRGADLAAQIAVRRTIPLDETQQIVTQLCRALSAVHAIGIVHRDVKPANILVERRGEEVWAKLADFGVAGETSSSITRQGTCIGTPSYMSPEQMLGRGGVDPQWDLWSLAAVAYYCLTGRPPFDGKTLGALCAAVHHGPRRVEATSPPLPAKLEVWFARALHHDPKKRFVSAEALGRTFEAACNAAKKPGVTVRVSGGARGALAFARTITDTRGRVGARFAFPLVAVLLTLMLGCIATDVRSKGPSATGAVAAAAVGAAARER